MPDDPLLPVSPDALRQALAYALSHRAGRASHRLDAIAYQIAAESLVEHLALSGYVVMQKPPAPQGPDTHYAPSVQAATRRP